MLTLFLAYIALIVNANAQVRFAPVEGQYEIKGEFQYLTTSANYPIGGGTSNSLFGGGKYTRMLGTGELTYDLNPAIRVWGGLSGGQSTSISVNAAQSVNGIVTQTNTNAGLNEGYLGSQWWTEYHSLDIVPQVDFVFPFFRVDENSTNPLLGEGAMRFQAGTWILLPLGDMTPFVYGGLTYRDGGRPIQLPYSAGVRFGRRNQWWIEGEFRGMESVTNDSNSDANSRAFRDAYNSRANGGSDEFYSINPSRHEVAASAGFTYQGIGIRGGISKTVFGQNSADDFMVTAGLTFDGSMGGKKKSVPVGTPGFTERGEKYDDTLFKGPVVPEEDPEVILAEPKPTPPPRKRPGAAKKPRKDEPMPNVELLMKDTQKSLEKKNGN